MYYSFVYLAWNTLKTYFKQIKTVSELKYSLAGDEKENSFCAPPPSPHFLATPLHIMHILRAIIGRLEFTTRQVSERAWALYMGYSWRDKLSLYFTDGEMTK